MTRARSKGAKSRLTSTVADPADIERTKAMLVDYFKLSSPVTGLATVDDLALTCEHLVELDNDGDLGVDRFWPLKREELCRLLAFPEGRPLTWSKYRSISGLTSSWDIGPNHPPTSAYEQGGDGMCVQPCELFTHQLVGVASILDQAFVDDKTTFIPGFILADGVGLGKSATCLAIISFLMGLYVCEKEAGNTNRPPIVNAGVSASRNFGRMYTTDHYLHVFRQ